MVNEFIELTSRRRTLGKALRKPFSRAKMNIQERKAEKRRIAKIMAEERRKLEREFIKRKAQQELSKKFTPKQFQLSEAQRKSAIARARGIPATSNRAGKKSVGDEILRGLGGFGIQPAIAKKKPKRKRQSNQFVIKVLR